MDQDSEQKTGKEELYFPKPSDLFAIELCFLLVVGLIVLAAFFQAFSYQIVSSRTPFVIMVPLLLLIGVHARRLLRTRHHYQWAEAIRKVLQGRAPIFRKIVVLNLWFVLLAALIQVAGHYVAVAVFIFMLVGYVAKERWLTAFILAVVVTLMIFVVFEHLFHIELYRGLIYRYFAGYHDF